jgi:hypothetical protein
MEGSVDSIRPPSEITHPPDAMLSRPVFGFEPFC